MGYQKVFYISIFVIATILIMALLTNGVEESKPKTTLVKTVIIEGLADEPSSTSSTKVNYGIEESFCEPSENHSLVDIDKKCRSLSDKNCSLVGCCVFLNGEKCVGGSSSGPTFLSVNGENVDVKYYRHKKKVFKNS